MEGLAGRGEWLIDGAGEGLGIAAGSSSASGSS